MKEDKMGIVYVLTGNGKGKTTAALGLALRVIGHGGRVWMGQFMKGRIYGEIQAARTYLPDLVIEQFGRDAFVNPKSPDPLDRQLAAHGLEVSRRVISSGEYNMVILDEINVAVNFGLIPGEEVVHLISERPQTLDLVLTGRYASDEVIDLADTVSEVREIKHHFRKGVKERPGMEY